MKKPYDSNGNIIGRFDGNFIYSDNGSKLYYLDGDDIFSITRPDKELNSFNKHPNLKIGTYKNGIGTSIDGEVLFVIK